MAKQADKVKHSKDFNDGTGDAYVDLNTQDLTKQQETAGNLGISHETNGGGAWHTKGSDNRA